MLRRRSASVSSCLQGKPPTVRKRMIKKEQILADQEDAYLMDLCQFWERYVAAQDERAKQLSRKSKLKNIQQRQCLSKAYLTPIRDQIKIRQESAEKILSLKIPENSDLEVEISELEESVRVDKAKLASITSHSLSLNVAVLETELAEVDYANDTKERFLDFRKIKLTRAQTSLENQLADYSRKILDEQARPIVPLIHSHCESPSSKWNERTCFNNLERERCSQRKQKIISKKQSIDESLPSLESQRAAASSELDALMQTFRELSTKLAQARQKETSLSKVKSDTTRTQVSLLSINQNVELLRRELTRQKQVVDYISQQNAELETRRASVAAMEASIDAKRESIKLRRQRLSTLNQKAACATAKLQMYQEKLQIREIKIDNIQRDIDKLMTHEYKRHSPTNVSTVVVEAKPPQLIRTSPKRGRTRARCNENAIVNEIV